MSTDPEGSAAYFPLSAFAGFGAARRALLCTLVDPGLGGVILSGRVGTGKSALLRSFGSFVRAHVDPDTPVVRVPIGVTDDRLIGGVDVDASLASGERRVQRGLIAEADGGFLLVDDLALLDRTAIASITRALETGENICEREGVSRCDPARFVLLATSVPNEREIPIEVADKVAFLLGEERTLSIDGVRILLRRLDRHARDPVGFAREHRVMELRLAEQVATARLLHQMIPVEMNTMGTILTEAAKLNVSGNRAEVFAARSARAHAALRGAREIGEEEIRFAIATVLAPRAQNVPDESAPSPEEQPSDGGPGNGEERPAEQPREDAAGAGADGRAGGDDQIDAGGAGEGNASGEGGDRVLDPVDFNAPLIDLDQFFSHGRSAGPGSRGEAGEWARGRHVRSTEDDLRGKRIAVGPTLRAAAPHQRSRRAEGEERVVVRPEDIRVKRFVHQAGTLFIFCVDASGSMAMNRMREAKGAVTRLLQDAYVNRDTVALISFRGTEAEVLLPPTSSVERAKRSLDVLPTGGGTPLASGLVKAYALVAAARRRGVEQVLVVLLTDGRANVPLTENAAGMIMELRRRHVRQEMENVALLFRRDGIRALVIDTRQTFGAASEAVRLAEMLDARYYYLPKIDAGGIVSVVRGAASE